MRNTILGLLRSAGSDFVSGEEIASRLGVSRTAVWKHIRELRASGYDIQSVAHKGYQLNGAPDKMLPAEIKNGLNTAIIGREIICFDNIPSTNNEAKLRAAQGAVDGAVVISEAQSGGKGRLDRQFFSPKGKGIWFSIILRPHMLPQEAPKFTLLSAVAVARAMNAFGVPAGIKWPNDILCRGKKLTGILTEMSAEMERINYVVIGTGINVNIAYEEFPEDIREKASSMAIMKGEEIPRVPFFQEILREFDRLYATVNEHGFTTVMDEWRELSITLGQEINVIGINETFAGVAVDIDTDGALLIDTENGRCRVLAGDVSIRPRK